MTIRLGLTISPTGQTIDPIELDELQYHVARDGGG